MKVVVAIDSFKGSLNTLDLGSAVEKGIKKIYQDCEVVKIPIADGGEGTMEALVNGGGGKIVEVEVRDPLMRPILAHYGIIEKEGKTAIIEMAVASGLPLLSSEERNPVKTTSYGTGELIRDAIGKGCRNFIVGLGGSATNDAGLGMLQSLGYRFLDKDKKELHGCGGSLDKVKFIDTKGVLKELEECKFLVACDVDNSLYGKSGAANVFGRQKGATEEMILSLDKGVKNFAELVKTLMKKDIDVNGAGAAGGLGGAFIGFLNSTLELGIDIVLKEVDLLSHIKDADFVITGEGKIDFQSIMGKAPTGVSKLCKVNGIPVIALAGSVGDDAVATHDYGVDCIFSIMNSPMSLEEAMNPKVTKKLVEKNTEEIFRLIKVCEGKFK